MVRNEDRSRPNSLNNLGRHSNFAAPRSHANELAVGNAQLCREQRMHLTQRLRILVDQRSDTPRLVTTPILRHNSACREEEWIVLVDVFGRRPVFKTQEASFLVRMMKFATFEKPRCSWMR